MTRYDMPISDCKPWSVVRTHSTPRSERELDSQSDKKNIELNAININVTKLTKLFNLNIFLFKSSGLHTPLHGAQSESHLLGKAVDQGSEVLGNTHSILPLKICLFIYYMCLHVCHDKRLEVISFQKLVLS